MSHRYERLEQLISSLKQQRDELAMKIHLGKDELKDEWRDLNEKLVHLSKRFEPLKDAAGETSEDVWEALKLVGEEVKNGFNRIRKAL
jgi:uncharacterized coiled-coil DUF342 family protein